MRSCSRSGTYGVMGLTACIARRSQKVEDESWCKCTNRTWNRKLEGSSWWNSSISMPRFDKRSVGIDIPPLGPSKMSASRVNPVKGIVYVTVSTLKIMRMKVAGFDFNEEEEGMENLSMITMQSCIWSR